MVDFGDFSFDPLTGSLSRQGAPIPIGQRAIAVLSALTVRRGQPVSKQDLMDQVWPGQAVEESNLTVQIAALRKILGVTSDGQDWIATLPRVGYRFLPGGGGDRPARQPAIAVLPFQTIGTVSGGDVFATGLAEDLITDLSKVPGLTVIARNSSFAFGPDGHGLAEIAAQLGVRFVVEGSVRRAAGRLRINAQLIDVETGTHIWADRFDGDLKDVFGLQDEVVGKIVIALADVLPRGAVPRSRRAASLEAYEYLVRGRAQALERPEGHAAGHPLLERAVQLDPQSADAHAWLAMSHLHAWHNWGQSRADHERPALAAARRAVALEGENAGAHAVLGYILAFDGHTEAALLELELALRLNPNHSDALALVGEGMVHIGQVHRGILAAEAAFVRNPFPPAWYHWILAFALYAGGDYQAVVSTLEHERTLGTGAQRLRAAALAQLGRLDEARAVADTFLKLVPGFTISYWSASQHFENDGDRKRFVEGYRKAGLPE